MRKLLLVLPILVGAAALPGSTVQAAPAAQPPRLNVLALTLAIPNAATETVQYYRDERRDERREWRRAREEERRRAEWRQQHRHYR